MSLIILIGCRYLSFHAQAREYSEKSKRLLNCKSSARKREICLSRPKYTLPMTYEVSVSQSNGISLPIILFKRISI